MVHIKRSTGYIQITLGIVLIFAVLVAHPWVMDKVREFHYSQVSMSYAVATKNSIVLDSKDKLDLITNTSNSILNSFFTVTCTAAIVLVLAIMMIFQGIANTRTGTEDDVHPKELGSFLLTLVLIIYVLAIAYVVFFISPPHERLLDATILILIFVFIGWVALLIRHYHLLHKDKPVKKKRSK
ncbi:hypothetical protein KY348_05430 [Candidatus Woesearchaeota archaeon]|nr:hypothetical protein [Candidatus Woesearchaeota archaeon]